MVAYMRSRGHNVTRVAVEATDMNVVRRLGNGTFEATAEPRQSDSAGLVRERPPNDDLLEHSW